MNINDARPSRFVRTTDLRGGAVTVITVNGTATGAQVTATSGITATIYLPAGQTIALTYNSTAPTWTWVAV